VLDKIAGELIATPRARSWTNVSFWGAAALALAAGIAVVVLYWPRSEEIPGSPLSLPVAARQAPESPAMPPPTLLAYEHVLRKSPDELNKLLDGHAAVLLAQSSSVDDLGSLYRELMTN
jgi:hypothetical protein